jgi:hypothetical protein
MIKEFQQLLKMWRFIGNCHKLRYRPYLIRVKNKNGHGNNSEIRSFCAYFLSNIQKSLEQLVKRKSVYLTPGNLTVSYGTQTVPPTVEARKRHQTIPPTAEVRKTERLGKAKISRKLK